MAARKYLNHNSILIRLFPKSVTMHLCPLNFLEEPITYTIIFEDQQKQDVVVTGETETIIKNLKKMPGYVVSSYGIVEALESIIGAFADDGLLQVDKTVDFEGYYYHDNEIQISRIDLDKKHPIRTKEEVIGCIKFLEDRSLMC